MRTLAVAFAAILMTTGMANAQRASSAAQMDSSLGREVEFPVVSPQGPTLCVVKALLHASGIGLLFCSEQFWCLRCPLRVRGKKRL